MNKRKITSELRTQRSEPEWLSPDDIAEVEITSENPDHPIEAALTGSGSGWRAEDFGRQTIRLKFEPPRPVRQVRIVIEEQERTRTQEFVLHAAVAPDGTWREIARQQFNFSPGGATRQQEDFQLGLRDVTAIEVTIVPDISGGDTPATIQQLRIAG